LRHGLVKCRTCSRLWNRDTNAASNIWKVAMSAIRREERPEYLRRARGSISGATSVGSEVPECLRTLPHNHDLRCEI
jgi:transposase